MTLIILFKVIASIYYSVQQSNAFKKSGKEKSMKKKKTNQPLVIERKGARLSFN